MRTFLSSFLWWPVSCIVLPGSCVSVYFLSSGPGFSSHLSHLSALGLLPPRTPFVGYWVHPRMGTVGAHGGLGVTRVSFSQPEGGWFSFPPHPHHLIHWSTLLSLRIVHLLSEWTNYTGCASLLFPDLADLLFIAFPKMFAGSVPFNPASAIWHSGWNTAITKHQRPLSADHLWGRGCYTLFF